MQIDRHHLPSMNKVFSLTTNTMEGGRGRWKEGREGRIEGEARKGRGRRQLRVLFFVLFNFVLFMPRVQHLLTPGFRGFL